MNLVLVPGLLCDKAVWKSQVQALKKQAHVQVADHGELDSLGAMAETILASAPPKFAIAGHSMGGRVALEVVRRAASRVTGLALLDTGYTPKPAGEAGDKEAAGRLELLDLARKSGMRAVGERWLQIPMVHAARLKDAGRPFSRQASVAKMVCTDNAMKVTTDAVQVLGGAGYTTDFPVERYMRETKVMQIFEGTNQIQRLVISRDLARG